MSNRKLGGYHAQKKGKNFETFIENSLRIANFAVINLPPAGMQWIGLKKTIPKKISCDFIIGKYGKTILLDAKSTELKNFSFSKANLKPHQIKDLYLFKKSSGCYRAGFVIHYQKTDDIYFFDIEYLWEVQPKESIDIKRGILIGSRKSLKIKWDRLV